MIGSEYTRLLWIVYFNLNLCYGVSAIGKEGTLMYSILRGKVSEWMSEKPKSLSDPPPKSPILGDFEGRLGSEVPQNGGLGGERKNL
jgi:hypothetical protein